MAADPRRVDHRVERRAAANPGLSCMDRTERFRTITRLAGRPQGASLQQMRDALEVSRATINRDLEYLRDRFNAPIEWDRDDGVYRLRPHGADGQRFELPGLWLDEREMLALLTMQRLVGELQPGFLSRQLKPLADRLQALIGGAGHPAAEIAQRVKVLPMGARRATLEHFEGVAGALLQRKRVKIRYRSRGRGEDSEREVSPQRLVHYRDNWYLDAWCHLRGDLRSFAVDAIQAATVLETQADDVPEATLDEVLGSGYGIFSGKATKLAKLRFSADRARWVACEVWHPQQKGAYLADGRYELELPYASELELVMDVMKYGAECEVVGPEALRSLVQARLGEAGRVYRVDM
jgi:predicted DNA-binding transcriptional regulator YafY